MLFFLRDSGEVTALFSEISAAAAAEPSRSILGMLVNLAAAKSRVSRRLVAYVPRLSAVWEREGPGESGGRCIMRTGAAVRGGSSSLASWAGCRDNEIHWSTAGCRPLALEIR